MVPRQKNEAEIGGPERNVRIIINNNGVPTASSCGESALFDFGT